MACEHEGVSTEFQFGLDMANYVFTLIFIVEAFLKLVAFGETYFDNQWQQFDFFVVTSSILDIMISLLDKDLME